MRFSMKETIIENLKSIKSQNEDLKDFCDKWINHLDDVCFCCGENTAENVAEQINKGFRSLGFDLDIESHS